MSNALKGSVSAGKSIGMFKGVSHCAVCCWQQRNCGVEEV